VHTTRARATIRATIASLERLEASLGEAFNQAVERIFTLQGRVVVTGMGKSGIVGKKISATLASTGTPSFFMHPAEAVHGDLGMLIPADVVLALSNSGETEEILELLNNLRLRGVPLIAIVGKAASTLARHADIALLAEVDDEGCPIGCAPMASTTTALVLGDALAAALMERRGFKREDFAVFHPRGSLGRRLTTTVDALMVSDDALPLVPPTASMGDVIKKLMATNLGAVFIVDGERRLLGLVTDGDIKRLLDREGEGFFKLLVADCMTTSPRTVRQGSLAEGALRIMEERRQITVLPVIAADGATVVGLIRLHDIIQAKIT